MRKTATDASPGHFRIGFLDLGEARRSVVGVWIVLAILLVVVAIARPNLVRPSSMEIILVLATITAVVGLGQGSVIFVGGIDLSVPWVMSASAIFYAGVSGGRSEAILPGLLAAFGLGIVVGIVNGLGSVKLKIHPVVMTLAMNAILQGSTLGYTKGLVTGAPPSETTWFMTGSLAGIAPVLWFLVLLAIVVTFVARSTAAGRRVQATGLNPTSARLAGVRTDFVVISAYVISSVAAAAAGVMLSGLASQSYLGMGDPYLVISIAVVALGGAAFSGGKGNFLGTLGAAILLSVLASLLTTMHLPEAARQIVLGVVILVSIVVTKLGRLPAMSRNQTAVKQRRKQEK